MIASFYFPRNAEMRARIPIPTILITAPGTQEGGWVGGSERETVFDWDVCANMIYNIRMCVSVCICVYLRVCVCVVEGVGECAYGCRYVCECVCGRVDGGGGVSVCVRAR